MRRSRASSRSRPTGKQPFEIELVDAPPWTSDDPALFPQWEPAVQRWVGERLLASHKSFTAEIEPFASRARLQRREERAYPLETVIRTSMMARLPLVGGLPLHAAGVVLEGRGVAFFGASGAGKTTLSATSPVPVLSDELVAIGPGRPFSLVRSGFWGEGRPQAGASALRSACSWTSPRVPRFARIASARRSPRAVCWRPFRCLTPPRSGDAPSPWSRSWWRTCPWSGWSGRPRTRPGRRSPGCLTSPSPRS